MLVLLLLLLFTDLKMVGSMRRASLRLKLEIIYMALDEGRKIQFAPPQLIEFDSQVLISLFHRLKLDVVEQTNTEIHR